MSQSHCFAFALFKRKEKPPEEPQWHKYETINNINKQEKNCKPKVG